MGVEIFDTTAEVISVTPEAAAHLKRQADAKSLAGVRIGVRESGCSISSCGVPLPTTCPPVRPAPGPISRT